MLSKWYVSHCNQLPVSSPRSWQLTETVKLYEVFVSRNRIVTTFVMRLTAVVVPNVSVAYPVRPTMMIART